MPNALAAARDHITADLETAIAALARMIACDTSFPPGAGYAAFADLLEDLFAPHAPETQRIEVPEPLWHVQGAGTHGPRINLIARARSTGQTTGRPPLGLYFHTDTVPQAAGWTRDPFTMIEEDDRLIGLGAADMKGTIAAVLLALRAAKTLAIPLAYDPMLLFCTDEEGGLYPGIRYLAEHGHIEGHVLNFNGTAAPRIWSGCFGLFNLLVRIHGSSGHAGDPAGALNAIEAAIPALNAIIALKPLIAARLSKLPPPPGAPPLAARLSIVTANGGTAGGQTPERFAFTLNRRYPPEEDFATARAELETTLRAALPPGTRLDIDLVGHLAPTADPTGPHWPRWQAALSEGFGYRPEDFHAWGASTCSDFGWVQQATGRTETLLTGLGRPDRNIHGPDEFTTRADLIALAHSVLSYLAADFAPDLIPETVP